MFTLSQHTPTNNVQLGENKPDQSQQTPTGQDILGQPVSLTYAV